MNPTPSVLLLIILHFLWSFPARGAELSIDADGILPKFDEPEWNEIEYSAIELREERAIVHSGAYFRRLTMFITDFRERSDHGYCGEFAAIWFAPAGNIHGFYFSERVCPI
jgi:hypothetical protein